MAVIQVEDTKCLQQSKKKTTVERGSVSHSKIILDQSIINIGNKILLVEKNKKTFKKMALKMYIKHKKSYVSLPPPKLWVKITHICLI